MIVTLFEMCVKGVEGAHAWGDLRTIVSDR
jgi:hypothetical protein